MGSDGSEQEQNSDEDTGPTNAGWVDSISKILSTQRPKGKKSLVLAKAKKLSDVEIKKPVDPGFAIDGEVRDKKLGLQELLDRLEPDVEPPRKKV